MRAFVAVVMGMSSLALDASPQQTPGACSLLTKDVLAAHSPAAKASLNIMLQVPAREDKIGGGTSCSYGGVNLQVDPFPAANFDRLFGKYTPVSGVGDKAYFHDNKNRFAELALMAGPRMLTIQMSVPDGKTAVAIQPNVVGLAKALLPKLK